MESKRYIIRRSLATLVILAGLVVLSQLLLVRCPKPPSRVDVEEAAYISKLYPWPDAKIPFACQTTAYIKSPFAPKKMYYSEDVFKEDGLQILRSHTREGPVVVYIGVSRGLYREFPDPTVGAMPALAQALSLSVDGKELQIGHIGYEEFSQEFDFTTILSPFLWPGKHDGQIEILLPSGETLEYEWRFEITWW